MSSEEFKRISCRLVSSIAFQRYGERIILLERKKGDETQFDTTNEYYCQRKRKMMRRMQKTKDDETNAMFSVLLASKGLAGTGAKNNET